MKSSTGHTREWREPAAFVRLMGGFEVLVSGRPISLPLDAQRLVAFLTLEGRPRSRVYVGGRLWSEGSQERAFGNLRSALWRVRREVDSLLFADSQTVSLVPGVGSDVSEIERVAQHLARFDGIEADMDLDHRPFCGELLAGWYDEWTLVERERIRQVCLHTLESIAVGLLASQKFVRALEAALAAVALEPLRESARRVVIEIHLAEGNHWEAVRHYEQFSTLLYEELGLRPSPIIEKQIAGLRVAV
jgi:DNA-binding SARP family transcriptional activator